MDFNTVIKVENLSKVYQLRDSTTDENGNTTNELWALKDVSFEIKKGESIGIAGPNGSGKSTLLKILAGITKPTSGKVAIRGKVASILDIGAGFHPELSGRENVYLNGQIHGFTKEEIERKFDEIVEFSGVKKFINEPVKNYSSGMYLRLAFSIMAHLDFDLYLLDEVLSVGDAEFRVKSAKFFVEKKGSKSVINVSHEKNIMNIIADRCFYFSNGSMIDDSSALNLLDKVSVTDEQAFFPELTVTQMDENSLFDISFLHCDIVRDIGLVFYNDDFDKTFVVSSVHDKSGSLDRDFKENRVCYSTSISSDDVTKDLYNLKVVLLDKHQTIVCEMMYNQKLEVKQSEKYTDLYFNSYPGAVRLFTNWKINYE